MERALANPWSSAYNRFGIVRGPKDLATLINLRGTGVPSKEAQRKISEFLTRRAERAIADLKRWLGLRRGRLPNVRKRQIWMLAARLRELNPKKYTWRNLARTLTKEECSQNPQKATDSIRHGVETILKERHG